MNMTDLEDHTGHEPSGKSNKRLGVTLLLISAFCFSFAGVFYQGRSGFKQGCDFLVCAFQYILRANLVSIWRTA